MNHWTKTTIKRLCKWWGLESDGKTERDSFPDSGTARIRPISQSVGPSGALNVSNIVDSLPPFPTALLTGRE